MFISVGIAQQYKTPLQTRQNNQQWSPRSSRAQALRSPLVRAVTHHKQQNAPCCRREHPNLLVAILDDANHRAGGGSRRCLTPSDMFRPGSATDARRVASSASIVLREHLHKIRLLQIRSGFRIRRQLPQQLRIREHLRKLFRLLVVAG